MESIMWRFLVLSMCQLCARFHGLNGSTMALGNRHKEDVALLDRGRRNCRHVLRKHDPPWSVAGVGVDVQPTNGQETPRQTDRPPQYHDRFPIDRLHHDAKLDRSDASLSGISTLDLR